MSSAFGGAEALDEARDGELHEMLAGAPLAIAGGAPGGDLVHGEELADDLFERPAIADAKLLAVEVLLAVALAAAADLDMRPAIDL